MSAEPGPAPPDASSQEFGLTKGATIGRYIVLGLLGRGGMGEVYAAFDPELDRKIAVKLLRARGANTADGRARLLREAQAIARLSHPNVVVVFDVGTFGDSVFIAMEFVEGSTLGYWSQAKPRSWREVLEVYAAAGRGLAAAHAAGLVHRDFKPDNAMITNAGQVRVMDFGLARQQGVEDEEPPVAGLTGTLAERAAALAQSFGEDIDSDATNKIGGGAAEIPASISGGYLRLKLTQTGTMLGTPAYMAPEQFAATGGDARTDQFSFCVALYEALYGQRPFAGANPMELMSNVIAGAVSDPPADARVPVWIRRILLRGLSTYPDSRFPSMTELLAALGQDPAVRRRRWLGAAAAVGILAAAAFGAQRFASSQHAVCSGGSDRASAAWGPDRRNAIERALLATGNKNAGRTFAGVSKIIDDYVGRWVGMYKETCEATHVRGEQSAEVLDLRMECLGDRLGSVRAVGDVLSGASAAAVDNAIAAASALPSLDRCADTEMLRAVIKPPDNPAVRARVAAVRETVAKVKALGDSGQCENAISLGTKVTEEAKALGYLPVQAEAEFAVGRLSETCLEPAKGLAILEEAAAAAETSRHDEAFVQATLVMASLYADRLHDIPRARENIRDSQAVLARLSGHKLLEAWVEESASTVELNDGNPERALQLVKAAYELRKQIYGADHYELTVSLTNIGIALQTLGRDQEAEPFSRGAVDIAMRLFGPDSTRTAMLLLNYGEILLGLGKLDEAQSAIETALSTWRRQNAGPYLVGYGLLDLGRTQLARGDAPRAVGTLEESLKMLANEDGPTVADTQFALAKALWKASPRSHDRSRQLARAAHDLAGKQPSTKRLLGEIDTWLSQPG
jgi:tRNA A-37 threonylcarbamoyl transferase component Bud32/tetratricopeptide (TPR) repeat protein